MVGTTAPLGARGARVRRWLSRYGPAEAAGIVGALSATAALTPANSAVLTAYGAAVGEAIAFYAVVIIRDVRLRIVHGHREHLARSTIRDLLIEFGLAEALDMSVVRPLAMAVGTVLLGNAAAGVIGGKLAADLVFYGVAATGYEIWVRRRQPARPAATRDTAAVSARSGRPVAT